MIDPLIALLTIVASLVLLDVAALRFGVESSGLDAREPPRRNI